MPLGRIKTKETTTEPNSVGRIPPTDPKKIANPFGDLKFTLPEPIQGRISKFFEPTTKVRTRDIARELPSVLKETFLFDVPFSKEERQKAEPTFKETAKGIGRLAPRITSEVATLGQLLGDLTLGGVEKVTGLPVAPRTDFRETKLGRTLEKVGTPKTAGEAKAFRMADVATFLPIGSLRISGGSAKAIAKSVDSNFIKGLLKKEIKDISEEGSETLSRILVEVKDPDNVQKALNRIEFSLKGRESRLKQIFKDDKPTTDPILKEVKKYKTINEGGKIKTVEGNPVKITDGINTFLHKDENGNWAVSEVTTGRNLSSGGFANPNIAIKEAKANINNIGIDETKKLISKKGLIPKTDLTTQASKFKTADEFVEAQPNGEWRIHSKGKTITLFNEQKVKDAVEHLNELGIQPVVEIRSNASIKTKSQLTDIFNKSKGEKPKKPLGTKKVEVEKPKPEVKKPIETKTEASPIAKESAKEGFPTKPVSFENYKVEQVSGAGAFDVETAHKIRSKPELTPSFVAMRRMRDGTMKPAVRESGIYAPKEFETAKFTDLSGLFGGKTFNFRDAAFSMDNITARQASKEGSWGSMVYQSYETRVATGQADTLAVDTASLVRISAENNGIKINKKTGGELFKGLNGGVVSAEMDQVVKEVRKVLNGLREQANIVRKQMGKKEIGFIEKYAPFMQEVHFWRDVMDKGKTEITDNFDFIIPNAKKNPHAIPRKEGAIHENLETNAWKLIETYSHSMSQDIFIAPQIEKLKAINSVLVGRNLNGSSNFINRFIRENLVGKAGSIDFYLGVTEGTLKRKVVGTFVMARNVKALAGNIVWTVFVQPASLVGMTLPRAGGVTRGLQNTLGGVFDFATDKALRAKIKTLPTTVAKTKGASLGMTGAGDLDRISGKIQKTRIETYNDFVGKIADAQEYWLTGASIGAGYREGRKIGLTQKNLDIFADWMGGATQSEYNKLARPLILNNLMVRAVFPFQTFATEMYRYVKTLAGLQGGMPLERSQRLNQAIMLIAGAYVYNQWSEKTTGRTLTTVGTAVPLIGGAVDTVINKGKGAIGFNTGNVGSGRSPIAPQEDILSFIDAVKAYTENGNIQPLRKELVGWGMGFAGISGASTVNRFVDGMIADVQGFQKTKSGKFAFIVEGSDRIIAPLMGPWSTSAGKDYINKVSESNRKKAKVRPIYDKAQELKNDGNISAAQALVDDLSAEDYKSYKSIVSSEKAKRTLELKGDMLPVYREAQELKKGGKTDEAQELVDNLSAEEYKAYQAITKEVKIYEDAKNGKKPSFADADNEAETYLIDGRIIHTIAVYAHSIGVDPVKAFREVFQGEKLRRVDNGAIILKRMPTFTEGGSQDIKKEMAEGADLKALKLDHTIPLQLGGDNSVENLKLVSTAEHKSYNDLENHLGRLLRDEKIKEKEAQQLITDFKEGKIPARDILNL